MRKSIVVALLVGAWGMGAAVAVADDKDKKDEKKAKVEIRDDCDPKDPAWAPTGGCTLKGGDVTFAEFGLLLFSPLSTPSIIGHPAWRMDPTYFKIEPGETVTAKNTGGRRHTFTEVTNFGGGFVAQLNGTLKIAPECAAASANPPLAPGASVEVKGLSVGNHSFQCCIHPWMRILIKVEDEEKDKD
jgi:plastocyanin